MSEGLEVKVKEEHLAAEVHKLPAELHRNHPPRLPLLLSLRALALPAFFRRVFSPGGARGVLEERLDQPHRLG